jgi:hypothetical protein
MTKIIYKSDSRRNVPVHLRDLIGISALEQVQLREMDEALSIVTEVRNCLREERMLTPQIVKLLGEYEEEIIMEINDVLKVEIPADYKHCLQMRKQPLAKIFFVSLLLRNAHNTMNGSQTSAYFNMSPPTFEEWVSQGPRAKPLPTKSIFSPNYEKPAFEFDSDDDINLADDD